MKTPLLIFSLFFSSFTHANRFELPETAARFVLDIKPSSFRYESEQLKKKLEIKKCNAELISRFNAELLNWVPPAINQNGVPFQLDEHSMHLDLSQDPGNKFLAMDRKVSVLLLQEKKLCQR